MIPASESLSIVRGEEAIRKRYLSLVPLRSGLAQSRQRLTVNLRYA
jgi:hypothetical protein